MRRSWSTWTRAHCRASSRAPRRSSPSAPRAQAAVLCGSADKARKTPPSKGWAARTRALCLARRRSCSARADAPARPDWTGSGPTSHPAGHRTYLWWPCGGQPSLHSPGSGLSWKLLIHRPRPTAQLPATQRAATLVAELQRLHHSGSDESEVHFRHPSSSRIPQRRQPDPRQSTVELRTKLPTQPS